MRCRPRDRAQPADGSTGYAVCGNGPAARSILRIPATALWGHTSAIRRRSNGICFSPDFKRAYVVDTGVTDGAEYPANIIVFDIDGIRCDTDGNVRCSWGWGAWIVAIAAHGCAPSPWVISS